ncbi:hypothetical protein GGI23_000385 [Coemansia sp. RSA 2559]|nr:hypothetical protein GGI23_000385 [Coemansia sp. RSA 2559]
MKYAYPNANEYNVPLPNPYERPLSHSMGDLNVMATRGRSESDGFRTMSARSSDDRAPLSTFFGTPTWQRMSTVLPQGVRDPLNIDELEREERLMPYTQMAVGAMDHDDILEAPPRMPAAGVGGGAHDSVASGTSSQLHFAEERTAAWGVKSDSMRGSRQTNALLSVSHAGGAPTLSGDKTDASAIDWAYMQDHNLRTGGLPSLDQVLTRRTRAPLALRDFAVHCSVRQPQARRWLEFYMAARTHEKMCLAYESDLRHAKARSQYASLDSHLLPPGSSLHQPSNRQSQMTEHNEKQHQDPARRAAARSETMKSLSRGNRHDTGSTEQVLVPEDGAAASSSAAGDAFRRSRRQSSHMAVQIQTAAETIFLRYFRAALDPNLLQHASAGASGTWSATGAGPGGVGQAYATPSEAAAAASARARGLTPRNNKYNGGGSGGKMGSLKRMLTQKTGAYASRTAHRPVFDDPYHQGYGVAATDSVYISPSAANSRPHNGRSRNDSGAQSKYDNRQGQLGSTESLNMSREHLNTPINADGSAGSSGPRNYLHLSHNSNSVGAGTGSSALGTRGMLNAFGASASSRNHLYYHMPWPPEILTEIEQRLLHDGAALDASLFSEALLYAYDVLDTYYFPIFIADAVSRNVTRDHCILRVMFAFILLWFGFALPLALILLDHEPKAQRAWSVLPLILGWWNMSVGFGGCDLLLAAMRKYQSPTMKDFIGQPTSSKSASSPQQQQHQPAASLRKMSVGDWRRAWFSTRVSVDPTATRMVRARSIRWFIGAVAMTAISAAILCAVPGTHIYTD